MNTTPLSLRIFWWGVHKIFLDPPLKLKLLFVKFLNSTPLPLRIFGGSIKFFRLQKYDREQSMFQNCTIQMLMDQQNIIHKQRETIEKNTHQLTKLKQKQQKN